VVHRVARTPVAPMARPEEEEEEKKKEKAAA
jgi:hypothetical protein